MKHKNYHIKSICLFVLLFLIASVGNGLLSQSLDTDYSKEGFTEEIDLKVYPNPASDYVIVSMERKLKGHFKLNNIFGKVLLEGELNKEGMNIDLLKYRTGIYIISIYDESGQKLGARKIIKN